MCINGVVFEAWEPFVGETSRPLTEADLGPEVAVVTMILSVSCVDDFCMNVDIDPCFFSLAETTLQDADKIRYEAGTPVYAVLGYATTYRLAVRQRDRIVLYQAVANDWARVGADLFNVGGRVNHIDVHPPDGAVVLISDPSTIDTLIDLLLAGTIVEQQPDNVPASVYTLVLHLDDGTTAALEVASNGRINFIDDWLQLRPEFVEIIERAVAASGARSALSLRKCMIFDYEGSRRRTMRWIMARRIMASELSVVAS